MKTAREIMSTAVISVTPEVAIDEAMAILIENKISGLPVVDGEGRLVGILSEVDRLKMLRNPASIRFTQVGDIMTRNVVSVHADVPLNSVADLLLGGAMRRLPVMDEGGLIGIISRCDLVRALYGDSALAG